MWGIKIYLHESVNPKVQCGVFGKKGGRAYQGYPVIIITIIMLMIMIMIMIIIIMLQMILIKIMIIIMITTYI